MHTKHRYVKKFRAIEAAAEAGGDALATELGAMRAATARVETLVRARLHEAATARDDAALRRWLPVVRDLELVDDGAEINHWVWCT